MAHDRWAHQVIEIKSAIFGVKTETIQEKLTQMGNSGWELVQVIATPGQFGIHLYFKRPL
ncbi:MAG: DUF4177 domain-containing protein [Arenimonas sp.]